MQNTKLIRRTLIHYCKTQNKLLNRSEGFFYLLVLLRLVYLLYKLSNRPDGFILSGTFTTCCTSYQIGQMGFFWHFRLDRLFYSLILNGFNIRNQLEMGGNYKYKMYTTKSWPTFDLYASLVWFVSFIMALFQNIILYQALMIKILWVNHMS